MEQYDIIKDKDQPQMDKNIKTEVEAVATSTAHIGMEFDLNHLKQEPGLSQSVNNEPVLLIKEEHLEDSSQDCNEQQSVQGASTAAGTDRMNQPFDTSLGDLCNVKQELCDVDIGPVVIQHMDIHYIINKVPGERSDTGNENNASNENVSDSKNGENMKTEIGSTSSEKKLSNTFKSPSNVLKGTKKRKIKEIEKRMDEAYSYLKRMNEKTEKDECSLYTDLLCKKLRGLNESTCEFAMLEIDGFMYRLKQQENNLK